MKTSIRIGIVALVLLVMSSTAFGTKPGNCPPNFNPYTDSCIIAEHGVPCFPECLGFDEDCPRELKCCTSKSKPGTFCVPPSIG